ARLIVRVKGRGLDWIDLSGRPGGEVTLRPGADVPIQGRVLNLEGRPVVGATGRVTEVGKSSKGNLDAYLNAWKRGMDGAAIPFLPWLPPEAVGTPTTTTDKQGRFRLSGFGPEQKVDLTIRAPGIEWQMVQVITRPGLKKGKGQGFLGPTFDL